MLNYIMEEQGYGRVYDSKPSGFIPLLVNQLDMKGTNKNNLKKYNLFFSIY